MHLKIHNRNCCAVSVNILVKCMYLIFGTMPVCCVLTLLKVALISVQACRLAHAQLCGKWSESSKVGRDINQQESDLNAFLF